MKYKRHVTGTVFTYSEVVKCPLAYVGRVANPEFSSISNWYSTTLITKKCGLIRVSHSGGLEMSLQPFLRKILILVMT